MLTINISYTGTILSMPIARSKRKLIAAIALFMAVGALTAAIGTGGAAATVFASTTLQENGGATTTGQQGNATTTGQQAEEQQQPQRRAGGGGGGGQIFQQGTVTSSPSPLPGREGEQSAVILPPRENQVYAGTLTYTASEPVQVAILQMQDLNNTEQQLLNATEDGFGTLLTSQLDNQTSIALTIISPDYGDSPVPSASIPFAGNALLLHTLDGTPFVATYTVDAVTQRPEIVNNISNMTALEEEAAAAEEEAAAAEEEAAAAEEEAAAAEEEAAAAEGNATAAEEEGEAEGA
jgi:hypothetical protein